MCGDARRPTFGERPARPLEGEVELGDLEEVRLLDQRSSEPLETTTTEPPIVADRSFPPSTSRPSAIRLGRPISKPCSMVEHVSPSGGRSKAWTTPANAAAALPVAGSSITPHPPANMRA